MISFTVSAPGKVILNGEHSVVYNKPAIAGVIGLRNYVTLTENDTDNITINFDMLPSASFIVPSKSVAAFIDQIGLDFNFDELPGDLATKHDEYLTKIDGFIQETFQLDNFSEIEQRTLNNSLGAVIYLLAAIEITHLQNSQSALKAFTLDFKSGIRAGAGTGSSASFSVSVAAAFYVYAKLRDDSTFISSFNGSDDSRQDVHQIVSSWAFLSERIIHKTPSGLDNTVCTFGNVVRFTKQPREIAYINPASTVNVILVNSGVSRDTGRVVGEVRKLKEKYPKLIDNIFDGMGEVVTNVVEVIESKTLSEMERYDELKRLFTINNNLLRAIGVSHPKLERIFAISEELGFSVKLTGAGAGGYAIILLPPDYEHNENYQKLMENLEEFDTTVTTVGGFGLQITTDNINGE